MTIVLIILALLVAVAVFYHFRNIAFISNAMASAHEKLDRAEIKLKDIEMNTVNRFRSLEARIIGKTIISTPTETSAAGSTSVTEAPSSVSVTTAVVSGTPSGAAPL